MARVTLNHPRTYMVLGITYEKDKPEIVDDDLGQYLKDTGHFTVVFAKEIESKIGKAPPKLPENPRQIVSDIKLATSKLDPNNNSHFTGEGKPQVKALTELLGYVVTGKMRDEALEAEADLSDPPGKLKVDTPVDPNKPEKIETVEEIAGKGGVKITITKRVKKQNLPADAATSEAEEDDATIDTGEGVEV